MLIPRSARRAAAVVSAAGVIVAILTASGAPASAIAAPPRSTASGAATPAAGSSVTVLPTTTTAPPASTTTTSTTKPPATTSTTRPKATTTTAPGSPVTGVPSVPVGGPPTTAPPKGHKAAPPPDPAFILTQVQADLSQLTAIQAYAQARAVVAANQQGVTLAAAALQSAMASQNHALTTQKTVQAQVNLAKVRLRGLAVAAYMGLGYLSPAAGSQGGQQPGNGTVDTPGGLTGTAAVDAQEMLRLVAQHDRKAVADTHKALRAAQRTTQSAGQGVAQAQAAVASAESALASSQQTLALVTKAATTPGVAAALNLLNLPGQSPTAGGLGGVSGAPASGLKALAEPAPPASTTTTSSTVVAAGPINAVASVPLPASPTILGPSTLTGAEIGKWFASTGKKANATVPMAQLAADYAKAGGQTSVRADLAFAQSVIETGFFSFPSGGQLTAKDNNFAGIGACDSCSHGWTFPDALTGVTAQMELLEAYASPTPVSTPLVGNVGIGGCCPTWMALAGKWASSLVYGISIMTIYHQMLTWVIPQRLVAAGLLTAPKATPAKGPTLATLPGHG
jgi:hypothetical protein